MAARKDKIGSGSGIPKITRYVFVSTLWSLKGMRYLRMALITRTCRCFLRGMERELQACQMGELVKKIQRYLSTTVWIDTDLGHQAQEVIDVRC